MKIEIITDADTHDCETCGTSHASGGKVLVDGVELLSKPASAHCFGGNDYSEGDLLVMALAKMGHEVLVDGAKYHVTCHDEGYYGPL